MRLLDIGPNLLGRSGFLINTLTELLNALFSMKDEARLIGHELLTQEVNVRFRIESGEALNARSDEVEFGLRVQLKFIADEEDGKEGDYAAQNTVEWGLGRGKTALRWLEQLQGKKLFQIVSPA